MSVDDFSESLLKYVGRLSQLGGISNFVHADGRAKGTSTLRVRTAAGFEFWVVPDRGMDIYEASFLGQSLCWHAPQGLVHPAYHSNRDLEWLKTFSGGLLTTCGLTTVGRPSIDAGEQLGLHGVISNTPAEQVHWSETWEKDDCFFAIKGQVREASVHGANMLLERTVSSSLNSKGFAIEDTVTNQGVRDTPLMILYHFNFGYPLLTSNSKVYAPSKKAHSIDAFSEESVDQWAVFGEPMRNITEKVYFHEMEKSTDGCISIVLVRDKDRADFGIKLIYDAASLTQFVQWKMTGENHFVLGLEPSNCSTLGRHTVREQGLLEMLQPGEKRRYYLELQVLDSAAKVSEAIGQ